MLAAIVGASLANRLAVLAAAAVLAALGVLALPRLQIDVLPDLDRPVVTVATEAHALPAEEVEQQVTRPLERVLLGLSGLQRLRSTSALGLSIVALEFDWGAEPTSLRQQIAERLAVVQPELPANVTPRMQPLSSLMGEIMLIAMTGDGIDLLRLRDLADGTVRPRLQAIPGVSQVTVIGGAATQVVVEPDFRAMAALDVSIADVERATARVGAAFGGGSVSRPGSPEAGIRARGERLDPSDISQRVVAQRQGVAVPLAEVARVATAPRPERGSAGFGGREAVVLSVQKQPRADTLQLTNGITAALSQLQATMPQGVTIDHTIFRQSNFIETAIRNVSHALRDASIVVAVVLMLFLADMRTMAVSIVAIPLSLLVAVLVFGGLGLTINTLTLGGLAIAVGELVDDAVVDVENVLRRLRENGASPEPRPALEVVAAASSEVRSGILLASLIIMGVLIPLFALGGVEGRLLRPLATAYIIAIGASLVTAITVTPVLCLLLLRSSAFPRTEPYLLRRAQGVLSAALPWAMRRGTAVLAICAGLVVLAAAGLALRPRSLMPAFNEGSLTIEMSSAVGTGLGDATQIGRAAEAILVGVPEVAAVGRRTGRAEQDEHAQGVETSEIDVMLSPGGRKRDAIIADVRARLAALPVTVNLGQPISHRIDHLTSGLRSELVVKVYGQELSQLDAVAARIAQELSRVRGLLDVQIERQARVPVVEIRPDTQRAALYGVTPATVLETITTFSNGKVVSSRWDDDLRRDLVIRLAEADRTASGLRRVLVETAQGRVPLSSIADVVETEGRNRIEREDGQRRIAITANLERRNVEQTIEAVGKTVASVALPPGFRVAVEGAYFGQAAATRTILAGTLVVLLLIFGAVLARYRSLRLAAIVLTSAPLALAGAAAALVLAGLPVSLASVVGFVAVIGIALRNSILKVSHTLNLAVHEGVAFGDALVLRASRERLAPVLMTTSATVCGLLPVAFGADTPGKEILHPVAVVVIGGLVASTLLDTFVVPLLLRRYGRPAFEALNAQPARGSF